MKRIKSSIDTMLAAVFRDNREYIQDGDLDLFLLNNLNQDSDYWWYLEADGKDDDDNIITQSDRDYVVEFITAWCADHQL